MSLTGMPGTDLERVLDEECLRSARVMLSALKDRIRKHAREMDEEEATTMSQYVSTVQIRAWMFASILLMEIAGMGPKDMVAYFTGAGSALADMLKAEEEAEEKVERSVH